MSDETIDKTFQVTDPARFVISNVRGLITIQPGEAGSIQVRAELHSSVDSDKNYVEMIQDADGTVRVETRSSTGFFGFHSHHPRVDYFVRVPQGIHLEASCVSSNLKVSELEGAFKLKTISGDIDLVGISGPLKLGAVSGDITGSRLSGVLDLDTVSGRARLTDSSFPSADASTVSGDLLLQTAISEGPYLFSSVSGDVKMIVPPDSRCSVELNSVSGSIRSSLPATAARMGHGLKVTQIQGGGTSVRLKSVSGGVSIETEGVPATAVPSTEPAMESTFPSIPPIPPIPPIPLDPGQPAPEPPAEQLSTSEILQRIERGELTVDEAIELMKGDS
ncbi:MAG: hypothetical protein C3F13_00975 [Anaerolineales bacterium]|nr:hypothetical protein [Anaerolineae bacterium]PWB56675.1 MAG: hypothetical protein C3F13_00975 [Anaerolineales bacterium]